MNERTLFPGASFLRGVGQIMLQSNAWTGLLFLVGIFYDSTIMGLGALLAVVTGTLTAKLLRYDPEAINAGLYGFSATLVGVALTFYFQPVAVIWVAIVVGAILATVLQHRLITWNIPGFTFPFIVVTWICLYLFHHVWVVKDSADIVASLPVNDDFTLSTHGFGEVIFQGSVLAGLIFFIAVFINAPVAALYGVVGSILGAFISLQFAEPVPDIHMGLFSFNAVLCAIAFSGNKPRDGIFVLLSVVLSVLIDIQLLKMNLSVLTFPFVAASWITLLVKRLLPASWLV
ncbi:urea transporter [Chitinophaga nivalis]|uniref:Urea transporter n=1 Tax=Chitinophaga nivalis TaxID=2991709 RepID=A0ABT3IGF6_9BACT|nr:urea transporter [Chitinophaga nivalis]MCW3467265.1 urea transporter [Chitinophaga nivalis]MCW3483043.1 urea transporter [Chitinophaga nivalis]